MDAEFNQTLENLRQAIEGNNNTHTYYNTELLNTLKQINIDLSAIENAIEILIRENEARNQLNTAEINRVTTEKNAIESELANIRGQLNGRTAESEDLRIEQEKLKRDFENREGELTRQLSELQQELSENRTLNSQDKLNLNDEISKTKAEIARLNEEFTRENAELRSEISDKTEEIKIIKESMNQLTGERDATTSQLTALASEKLTLENSLRQSIDLMNEATQRINSFTTSEPPNRQEIQHIKDIISEIKNKLNLNPSTPRAQGETQLIINGQSVTNKEIEDAFIELSLGEFNTWDPIFQAYISSSDRQTFINELDETKRAGLLENIKENRLEEVTGGKKGRKIRKIGRRKTRKTKKIRRRQRGGFHYSQNARRRNITTTSSSKRSSKRRTKRTSSI
jgi:hypothetical protein